jgi:phosphatidylglycerophosphate synthase
MTAPPDASPSFGRRLTAAAAGTVAAAALGLIAWQTLPVSQRHPLIAALFFAVWMKALLPSMAHGHPHAAIGPANRLTMLRAVLVAFTASLVFEPAHVTLAWAAVAVALVVAVLDGVDGWLARRSGMASAFGARFDMETDAALIAVLSVLVWHHDKAGGWVIGCGLMRYAFVVGGWTWTWLAAPLRSTWRGKAVAVGQVVGLSVALAPPVARPWSVAVAAVALAALAWSFALDVAYLWRQSPTRPT